MIVNVNKAWVMVIKRLVDLFNKCIYTNVILIQAAYCCINSPEHKKTFS